MSLKHDLIRLTLAEAKEGLRKKKFSSVELTEAYLKAMGQHQEIKTYIFRAS